MRRKQAPLDLARLAQEGLALLNAGRPKEALDRFDELAKFAPRDPATLAGLSAARFALDDYEGALAAAEMLAALRPFPPQAALVLPPAAIMAQKAEAGAIANHMLRNLDGPGAAAAAGYWAARLSEKENFAAAADAYRAFAEAHDGGAAARLRLAELHLNAGDPAAAAPLIDELLRDAPDAAEPNALAARLGVMTGDLAGAETNAVRALARDPGCAPAFTVLSETAPSRIEETLRTRLAALAAGDGENAILAAYALARALEDRKEFDAAFEAYERGNALTRAALARTGRTYAPRAVELDVRETCAGFSADAIDAATRGRSGGGDLAFIVGAPRSGSTLVDQILASHSRVASAGENVGMKKVFDAAQQRARTEGKPLAGIAAEYAEEWDAAYRESLPGGGGDTVFVDKAPLNIWRAGFILALYPEARILVTQRDPMDNGLSLFRANFLAAHDYAADLAAIGHYLLALGALARWWRAAAPDRVSVVVYEDLIRDIDAGIGQLLGQCGLAPEPACFRFWEHTRPVFTLSAAQVRRRPTDAACGRWRRHEARLAPLTRALAAPFPH